MPRHPPQKKKVTRASNRVQADVPNPQADVPNPQADVPNPQADVPNPQADEWSTPSDFEDIIQDSPFLKYLQMVHRKLTVPFEKWMLEFLSYNLGRRAPHAVRKDVEMIDRWFARYPQPESVSEKHALTRVQDEWQELKKLIYKPLAPSAFAKSSGWVEQQSGPALINCRRPPKNSGLPLNLLHPLFAEFVALIEQPPPDYSDSQFIHAEQVAISLCQAMPLAFDKETVRVHEFKRIVSPLFKGLLSKVDVGRGCEADFGIWFTNVGFVLLGEAKNEPGSSGDVYMQAAASYDSWAANIPTQTIPERPCFVLCVDGPNILFGGGFRDNGVSVVEPLSNWCVMMEHAELKRERDLARHLYALLRCLDDESKFSAPLPSITAFCPRIYDTFVPPGTNESVQLKFIKPFEHPWHSQQGVHDLLFRASVEEKTGDGQVASPVLVKVPSCSRYGLDPHLLAADAKFAPRLLGTAKVEGAPTIYVMELLSNSEGWFHLVDRERPKHITKQQKEGLRKRGKEFLSFLLENSLVHGDLRGCNIMCRLRDEDDVDLRVLDWDWAGGKGVARYPAGLNVEAGYQGSPGGLIEASYDRHMLEKTVDDFLL